MVVIIIIPLIIAHRGASYYRPENTMSAFQLAYDQHADGIETDIHLTKDQVPVLIHDKTINRITNEHGPVNEWNFKDLKQLDIGSWFNSEFKEERIVALEELLQWAQAKDILINLELKIHKSSHTQMEDIVYDQVKHYNLLDRVIFSSFNSLSIKKLMEIDPSTKRALLTKRHNLKLIDLTKQLQTVGIHIKHQNTNQTIINKYHHYQQYVGAYTINHPQVMRRCFRSKCDMIITDRPDLAIEKRQLYLKQITQ